MPGEIGSKQLSGLPMLQVYLLEPPKAEWAHHLLFIPRCQIRALLYRLAVRPPDLFSRAQLCLLF